MTRVGSAQVNRALLSLLIAVVVSTCSLRLAAQTWAGLRVEGQEIIDQNGNNVLLRGFGPGEWTNTEAYMIKWPDCDPGACTPRQHDALYGYSEIQTVLTSLIGSSSANEFWQTWQANDVSEADFARMQAWGANSLRLSMNYHWLSPAPGTYLASGWQWIDQVIAWGKAHNIKIILCLHAAPGSQSNYLMADTPDPGKGIQPPVAHLWSEPSIYQPWTINLWAAIAQRYAHETQVAGYDLLDEPILRNRDDLRPFYIRLTSAIRAVDTNHILFIEGLNFAGDTAGIQAVMPPWDSNMVMVFHKYWDANNAASIQGYLDIRSNYKVPLWNGETGENTASWDKEMVQLLTANNIGWNSWTYKKINNSGSSAYSIREPSNYDTIKKYVKCWYPGATGCAKPSRLSATAMELALAANAATPRCTYESAVVDALFGTQHSLGISINPVAQSLTAGAGTSYALTLFPFGTSGNANLVVSGLPVGGTSNFSSSTVSVSGTSMLNVSTSASTAAGEYTLAITGTTNGVSQTVYATLIVSGN